MRIYDAAKGKLKEQEAAVNPLVQDGKKLVPSVTRVFSTGRELYLQAYRQSAPGGASGATTSTAAGGALPDAASPTASRPLLSFVSLSLNGVKTLETPPIAVVSSANNRLGMVPFSLSIPLRGLRPGQFECQITVIDPATQKAAFWEAPIELVP